jgi:hypothetical protein
MRSRDQKNALNNVPNPILKLLPPYALIAAVALLNFGLHTRVAPTTLASSMNLPHWDTFERKALQWTNARGDWKLEAGRLLSDGGEHFAQVPVAVSPQAPYTLKLEMHLEANMTSIILFNGQVQGTSERSQAIRIKREGPAIQLEAGFNNRAQVFQSEHKTTLWWPKDLKLELQVGARGYTLQINEQTAFESLSLHFRGGFIALQTNGIANFDNLLVQPSNLQPDTNASSDVARDWNTLSGTWAFHRNELRQENTQGFDQTVLTARAQANAKKIRLGFRQLYGSGAGLIFNAKNNMRLENAHLVRYSDDGKTLFWGSFDQRGDFHGQGYQNVRNPGIAAHTLEVKLGIKTYSVMLDGLEIANKIPLLEQSGFVGMSTSKSAASFSKLEIKTETGTTQLIGSRGAP